MPSSTSEAPHGDETSKESPRESSQADNVIAPSDDVPDGHEDRSLLTLRKQRIQELPHRPRGDWLRPYWLGAGLFLALLSFWTLDTLKDPIFGALTGGNFEVHQPPAKLFSVCMTLVIVCFLEYVSSEKRKEKQQRRRDEEILDPGGRWSKMALLTVSTSRSMEDFEPEEEEDRVSGAIFMSVGVPYCVAFGIMAYLLQFNQLVASTTAHDKKSQHSKFGKWHVLGYFLYAGIESFGSIAVATFWSFANSTLSLDDAERYYGLIIAIAQLGAIAGSTMVTADVWSSITLLVMSCLIILLHVLVMMAYDRRFPPTSDTVGSPPDNNALGIEANQPTLWSGVYLILRHNYVLLILGVSCLYEVSLTCLNYQMTLLGWSRFEETEHRGMSFTQFMGHYGQMVNMSSLALSSIVFPSLIRRYGLRITLRLFPSLLLLANFLAFMALPGNLAVLFISMAILKAMTYSIHDPSKEILYLPTSNAIKFKAKFWIDVVGARFAKAIGSSINTLSGSVDRSIQVASAPSLLTAIALWFVCYRAGNQFNRLLETGMIVGVDDAAVDQRAHVKYRHVTEDEELVVDTATDDGIFEDPTTASMELSPLRRL